MCGFQWLKYFSSDGKRPRIARPDDSPRNPEVLLHPRDRPSGGRSPRRRPIPVSAATWLAFSRGRHSPRPAAPSFARNSGGISADSILPLRFRQ